MYYYKSGSFFTLYDFGALTGDTFTTVSFQEHCDTVYTITIDSIRYIYPGADSLKKYYFHANNDTAVYFYLEKAGYPDYLLPVFDYGCETITGPHFPGPLRCYYDNTLEEYSTGAAPGCEYITGINNPQRNEKISAYPNPTQGKIRLTLQGNQQVFYEIFNVYGQLLNAQMLSSPAEIDFAPYGAGIYFLKIQDCRILEILVY